MQIYQKILVDFFRYRTFARATD